MKKISTILVGLSLLASSTLFAEEMDHSKMNHNMMNHDGASMSKSAYHNTIQKDGYVVMVMSEKPLVSGLNKITVMLKKDGKSVQGAKVKAKFFMPEMPGMPYMEYKAKGKAMGDMFHMDISLGMSGTWQYHLDFKTSDGKVHKTRGSVNL